MGHFVNLFVSVCALSILLQGSLLATPLLEEEDKSASLGSSRLKESDVSQDSDDFISRARAFLAEQQSRNEDPQEYEIEAREWLRQKFDTASYEDMETMAQLFVKLGNEREAAKIYTQMGRYDKSARLYKELIDEGRLSPVVTEVKTALFRGKIYEEVCYIIPPLFHSSTLAIISSSKPNTLSVTLKLYPVGDSLQPLCYRFEVSDFSEAQLKQKVAVVQERVFGLVGNFSELPPEAFAQIVSNLFFETQLSIAAVNPSFRQIILESDVIHNNNRGRVAAREMSREVLSWDDFSRLYSKLKQSLNMGDIPDFEDLKAIVSTVFKKTSKCASYFEGLLYEMIQDYPCALEAYLKAASEGYDEAISRLARANYKGELGLGDIGERFRNLMRLAETKSDEAKTYFASALVSDEFLGCLGLSEDECFERLGTLSGSGNEQAKYFLACKLAINLKEGKISMPEYKKKLGELVLGDYARVPFYSILFNDVQILPEITCVNNLCYLALKCKRVEEAAMLLMTEFLVEHGVSVLKNQRMLFRLANSGNVTGQKFIVRALVEGKLGLDKFSEGERFHYLQLFALKGYKEARKQLKKRHSDPNVLSCLFYMFDVLNSINPK